MQDTEKFSSVFSVQVYSLENYNETLSKGRCKIFYKGKNRNATYISEEFAEKLLSTIAYTPIKGIYSISEQDFTDHGAERDLGKIYGIVPENYNLAWEKHLDKDGVEREYACVDVLIYTGLYKEAKNIVGSAQSMELYVPSVKGNWKIMDGKKFFEFEDGCFLGLQVLGTKVEPCFEGASFFTLLKDLESYSNKQTDKMGEIKMDIKTFFKLSDDEKFDGLWDLLNSKEFEASGNIPYCITKVYDNYALAYNRDEKQYYRAYYKKDDELNSLEITELVKVFILDVTEAEKNALEGLRKLNNNSFEKVDSFYDEAIQVKEDYQALKQKAENFDSKIESMKSEISTLQQDKVEDSQLINSLKEELESLKDYKKTNENNIKQEIINKYTNKLADEILDSYKEKIDEYSVDSLKKELAFVYIENTPDVFSMQIPAVPKDKPHMGIEAILDKYEKR